MGPIPTIPPPADDEPRQITVARKLRELLPTLTAVEEAAIRQIAPLLSIIRLAHGNIASRGNTSCVWQKSKLSTVLPNLPEECKFMVIERQKRNANGAQTFPLGSSRKCGRSLELVIDQGINTAMSFDDRLMLPHGHVRKAILHLIEDQILDSLMKISLVAL